MSTLITLVGQQPGAIAVTAKTLIEKEKLSHVVLLPTEQTFGECHRLMGYLDRLKKNSTISWHIIATELETPSPRYKFAWDLILEKLRQGNLPEPVYFDTSPGLNYQIALISHYLREEPRLIPLYAEYNYLYCLVDENIKWELSDIGFKELLDLHQLEADKIPSDLGGFVEEVTIKGTILDIKFIKAREKCGRLHGLARIWADQTIAPNTQEAKDEAHRIKQDARRLEAVTKSPSILNNLRPVLCVWTNSITTANRLQAYGIKWILTNDIITAMKTWEETLNQPPGQFIPGESEETIDLSKGYDECPCLRIEWKGENLIVSLGSDPSSTLLSIFTHKPSIVVILVDDNTPWIKSIAKRIKDRISDFSAEKVIFLATDISGNIPKKACQKLSELLSTGGWAANITPGTKGQTWNMARLSGVMLWSLENQNQQAKPLQPEGEIRPLTYSFPPLLLQASVNGGRLKKDGISKEEIKEKEKFLLGFINIIASYSKKNAKGKIEAPVPWDGGAEIFLNEENYIKCTGINPGKEEVSFEVSFNRVNESGSVTSPPDDLGRWLEELVAGAFLAAGGSKITDLRVGMRWDWLENFVPANVFRTDVDIVAQWKGQYIAISCKLGVKAEELEEWRAEIMAEGRAGLGRMALPVLVRGGIPHKKAERIAGKSIQNGFLEIGLTLLNDHALLNHLVEQALEANQTLS